MKLDIAPTSLVSAQTKRKWLLYEMMRFHDASSKLVSVKNILQIGVAIYLFMSCSLWVGLGLLVLELWILDKAFRLLHAYIFADFYVDLSMVAFEESADVEQDLRILLNRVGNIFKNEDPNRREALDEQLKNSYTMVQTKFELREAIHEIDKGKVSAQVQKP